MKLFAVVAVGAFAFANAAEHWARRPSARLTVTA
jgi:hypothetical protein